MATASNSPGKKCDGHSVAVIVVDRHGRVLIGDIPDGAGASSVAGHVFDVHPDPDTAAREEVHEEVGATIKALRRVVEQPVLRLNPCKRGNGPDGVGHYWRLYVAEVEGPLTIDPGSFRNVRWVPRDELQALAQRTLHYVQGKVTAEEWAEEPGLTVSWVQWFVSAGFITIPEADLREIEVFMVTDGACRR